MRKVTAKDLDEISRHNMKVDGRADFHEGFNKGRNEAGKGLRICCVILAILLLLTMSLYAKEKFENMSLKKGLGDFMGYMINVTNHCVELNNMTYNELLESYLKKESDRIIEDWKDKD